MESPPCRVCGKTEPVLCYPDDQTMAICPECCDTAAHPDGETGHRWQYDPGERDRECRYCGIYRKCTKYAYDD